jgi:hypothetical protein
MGLDLSTITPHAFVEHVIHRCCQEAGARAGGQTSQDMAHVE